MLLAVALPAGAQEATSRAVTVPVPMAPLPGGLDGIPVFNSNNPEVVASPGILLSTLAAPPFGAAEGYTDTTLQGRFSVFSHHIARDLDGQQGRVWLGLVASNTSDQPVTLRVLGGASYLSQPEAPFVALEPLIGDPYGLVYAGPGSRVATELVHGDSPVRPAARVIPPGKSGLVYNLPVPVWRSPGSNGRTTLLHLESDGPVRLSEVALVMDRHWWGFAHPHAFDYEAELNRSRLAGPREAAATAPDQGSGPFRYGRVAGISQGDGWVGTLPAPTTGLVGYPIASVARNRLGTAQVQSAPMLTRLPGSAYAAHGNYGVSYRLTVPLENPGSQPRRFDLALSHPSAMSGLDGDATATFLEPPAPQVRYRGAVRLDWTDERGRAQSRFVHLVIRHGERMPPFATLWVPAGATQAVTVSLIYPADATPPQLFSIEAFPIATP